MHEKIIIDPWYQYVIDLTPRHIYTWKITGHSIILDLFAFLLNRFFEKQIEPTDF